MNVLEINKGALRSLVEPLVEQIARDKAPSIVVQRYVNTKDAAKYLGVSFPTFKKWVEEKKGDNSFYFRFYRQISYSCLIFPFYHLFCIADL